MSQYDEYFTDRDKPFAENLNDALLVSNVFDLTVPIVLPVDFSNGVWVDTGNKRKCHVSIVQVTDFYNLTVAGSSLTGYGDLRFRFYPNFNSFGKIRGVDWNGSVDEVIVNDANGNTLCNVTEPGNFPNVSGLRTLQNFEIIVKVNGELEDLTLILENKVKSARHTVSATVEDIDGLSDALDSIETINSNQDLLIENKVDKVNGKGLSTNDYTNADKNKVDNLKSVATSGSYNDLTNKPAIPTKTSDLTNDGADGTNIFVSNNDSRLTNARAPTSHTHGNVTNDGKIGTVSGKLIATGTGGVLQAVDTITKSKISDFPTSMTPTSHTHTKSQITDFPTSMTPTSHSHGSLANGGTLNSDTSSVNKVAVTDSNNALKTISKVPFSNLNISKANITGLGIPSQDTTYSNATTSSAGLMSSSDKSKLDGVATGATKNTIDSALSSTSTNAVQNKVINTALNGKANSSHTHTIANVTNLENTLNGKASSTHSHGYINNDGTINTVLPSSQEFEYVLVQETRGGTIFSHNRLSKKLMGLDWKNVTLTNMSGVSLSYNDLLCRLIVAGSYKISTANSYTNMVTGTIPADYRPTNGRVELNTGDVLIRIKLTDDGHLQYYSPQTFTSNVGLYAEFIWSR